MKILFQGDSITDADRDRSDIHNLGRGYPKYAAEYIKKALPDKNFEFVNLGVGGDKTENLVERLQPDFINIQPDFISIMIGVNDTWHHAAKRDWIPADVFENNYRTVLEAIKTKTDAKIMIIEPFLIPVPDKEFFRVNLDPNIQIIRKLAREYADIYLPTDGLLAFAFIGDEPTSFAADGVHPTAKGADFIGRLYCEYAVPLLK